MYCWYSRANDPVNVTVSPSGPRFFRYTFPTDVQSLVATMTSEDDICMIFSIQEGKVCVAASSVLYIVHFIVKKIVIMKIGTLV